MAKPTAAEWQRLANLKRHNEQKVADLRALPLGKGKRGDALRLRKTIAEATRLEKELNRRAGRT